MTKAETNVQHLELEKPKLSKVDKKDKFETLTAKIVSKALELA